MTAVQVKLLGWLSSFLDENDRESVLGDMAEEDAGYLATVVAICGLVFRKEAGGWRSASPWLVLILLLLPCVFLLVVVMNSLTDVSAIYLWMLINNADANLLRQAGYWSNVWTCLPVLLWGSLALVGWSCCAGFVIESACGRVRRTNLILMALLLGFVILGWVPFPVHAVIPLQGRDFIGNAAVFRNVFYRDVFPWLVLLLLVVAPAARGMNDAQRCGHGKEQRLSFVAPGLVLLSLVAQVFVPGPYSILFSCCGMAGVALPFWVRAQGRMPTRLPMQGVQTKG